MSYLVSGVSLQRGECRGNARLRRSKEVDEEGDHLEATPPARNGVFNRPTDVTWDTQGNIFVSDGYNNSRVAKFTKDGAWVKAIGERGAAPNQFNTSPTASPRMTRATSTSPTAATAASRSTIPI